MTALVTPKTEADLLHDMCIEALEEEQGIQSQLVALQLKLKRLRHNGKKLDTELSEKHVKSNDAFEAYAKKTCLEFCEKIRKTFPREVRDIIYTHVTGYEDVNIAKPQYEMGTKIQDFYFESSSQCDLVCLSKDGNLKHYWNADYVGMDMSRELGENYYRSVTFEFQDKFDLMAKFRIIDQWGLGFSPVNFVKSVGVSTIYDGSHFLFETEANSKPEYETYSWGSVWDAAQGIHMGSERGLVTSAVTHSELLVHMEPLFGFRSGTAITFRICLRDDKGLNQLGLQKLCKSAVSLIFPTLQRLRDMGFRFRIAIVGREHGDWVSPFTSAWNPASPEELADSFRKYVDLKIKAEEEAEISAMNDEMFGYL